MLNIWRYALAKPIQSAAANDLIALATVLTLCTRCKRHSVKQRCCSLFNSSIICKILVLLRNIMAFLGFTLRKVSFHMAAKPISAKGMRWLRSLTFQTQDIVIMGYINGIGQIFTTYSRPLLKRSGAFFAGSYLAMAFATGIGASESSIEFQAIGKRFIGTWSSSGTYSTDYPGVGKKGDKFRSKSTCRWAAGSSAILCESDAGDTRKGNGMQLIYWDPALKKLRVTVIDSGGNYDQGIGSMEAGIIEWASFGNFADGRAVEYKWKTVFSDDGNTHVHTGFVEVDGVRNNFTDTLKRVVN